MSYEDEYESDGRLQYVHRHGASSSAPQSQTLDLTLDSSDDDGDDNDESTVVDDDATEEVSFQADLQRAIAASTSSSNGHLINPAAAQLGRSLWADVFESSSTASTAVVAAAAAVATVASTAVVSNAVAAAKPPRANSAAKEAAKAAKAAEKAAKQAQRDADKAAKLAQREALKARKRKSRDEMLSEMSVAVDQRLIEQGAGAVILSHMQTEKLACRVRPLPIASVFEWYRGEPATREATVAVRLLGDEFVARSRARTVDALLRDAQRAYGADVQLLLIIEGLDAAITQDERLRAGGALLAPFDRLGQFVELEMAGVVVHESRTPQATAEYVLNLTRSLSERPYRKKPAFVEFCAEALGGKAAGLSGLCVWGKQLAQVQGVSPPIAQAIVARYPTFKSLVIDCYFAPHLRDDEKQALLAGIPVPRTTASGATTTRAIGAVVSARVHQVFTVADPNAQIH